MKTRRKKVLFPLNSKLFSLSFLKISIDKNYKKPRGLASQSRQKTNKCNTYRTRGETKVVTVLKFQISNKINRQNGAGPMRFFLYLLYSIYRTPLYEDGE